MNHRILQLVLAAIFVTGTLRAQVPQLINYQGRVAVGTVNFDGSGAFKFALVSTNGLTTFWSNDGTSVAGSQPTAAVTLAVTKGLYSVLLGDATLPGMTIVPATVFTNADVRLRVWFNDGPNGSQLLTPDQRIAAVGYAMIAGNVQDGAITSAKIAAGAVTSTQLAAGSVQTANLAASAVANGNLVNSGITITAGSGIGGGGAVSLGGSIALANSGVLSLTGGGGITVNVGTGAVTLGSNATSANTPGAIVLRDVAGNFSASGLNLPLTTSATAGVITLGGARLIHAFGGNDFFAGMNAGNFTMGGSGNTAIGSSAMQISTGGNDNTAVGYSALYRNAGGENNTASGVRALLSNTGGSSNTASGVNALTSNTTGSDNTAIGRSAMGSNSIGTANTAIGVTALFGNTTGSSNTASGYEALRVNTTGYYNTAGGAFALSANSTGFENTANGVNALTFNGTGLQNTASGVRALGSNTGGSSNTAIGVNALRVNTTGTGNIALGRDAGSNLTTGNNNITIGNPGIAGDSGTIRIGTTGTHSDTFLTGIIRGEGILTLSGFQPYVTLFDTNSAGAASRFQTAGGDLFLEPASYLAGQLDTGLVVKTGTGFVGIGTTTPIAKLHALTSQSNKAAVYGDTAGTNGVGVIGNATGPGGVGVYGRSTTGAAVHAEGNATQALDKGGFVKAMAFIDPFRQADQYVVRCYNSQLVGDAATTAPGGIMVYRYEAGSYGVNFGFNIDGRFISVSVVGAINSPAATLSDTNQNGLNVYIKDSDHNGADAKFYIFVF